MKYIPRSWLGGLISLRWQCTPNWSTESMKYLSETKLLSEIDTMLLKFTRKWKGARIAKTIFLKKNNVKLTLPNFKSYCITTVIRIGWYGIGETHRSMESNWESSIIHPYICGPLDFHRVLRQINGERAVFSANCPGTTGCPHAKERN